MLWITRAYTRERSNSKGGERFQAPEYAGPQLDSELHRAVQRLHRELKALRKQSQSSASTQQQLVQLIGSQVVPLVENVSTGFLKLDSMLKEHVIQMRRQQEEFQQRLEQQQSCLRGELLTSKLHSAPSAPPLTATRHPVFATQVRATTAPS